MLCIKPLIEYLDVKLISKNGGKQFISYKYFPYKKDLQRLIVSNKVRVYPCGSCLACINMKRYHWVKKLELEKSFHKNCYFLTLTYNNDNLPYELKVKDLQNFIKYLRKLISPVPLRYFACGEYGDKTKRPHYHVILFTNYDFDLEYLKSTKSGILFDCELINKAWRHKGYIWVAHDIGCSSFAYVATYSNKSYLKQAFNERKKGFEISKRMIYEDDELSGFEKYVFFDLNYMRDNILPKSEFVVCSKNPPLGSRARSLNSPSSLLKWFDKQDFLERHVEKYYYDDDGKKYAILKDIDLQKTKWCEELSKRQQEYINFCKNNNMFDVIETNRLIGVRKKIKKDIN